jgi:hypothetical protein
VNPGKTAYDRPLFEYQNAFAGFRKVSRARKPIVSTADDNSIVA